MHGFRVNEVLLLTGNDVIVIYLLEGVSHRFCWRYLKERPRFHSHGLLTYLAYLLPFRSYSLFVFGLQLPIPTNFRGVCFKAKTLLNFRITHFSSPKGSSLHQTASFELMCAKIGSRLWAVALLKNLKTKKSQYHICWPYVASRPLIGPERKVVLTESERATPVS